jgi:hypothetical protein
MRIRRTDELEISPICTIRGRRRPEICPLRARSAISFFLMGPEHTPEKSVFRLKGANPASDSALGSIRPFGCERMGIWTTSMTMIAIWHCVRTIRGGYPVTRSIPTKSGFLGPIVIEIQGFAGSETVISFFLMGPEYPPKMPAIAASYDFTGKSQRLGVNPLPCRPAFEDLSMACWGRHIWTSGTSVAENPVISDKSELIRCWHCISCAAVLFVGSSHFAGLRKEPNIARKS